MHASGALETLGEAVGLLVGFGLMSAWVYFQPELLRPDIAFGARVAAGFRDQPAYGLARRTYRRHVLLHLAISVVIALVSFGADVPWLMAIAVIWPTAVGLPVASLSARRMVLPFTQATSTTRHADVGAESRAGLPGGVAGQLGPFAIIGIACAYMAAHRDLLWHASASSRPGVGLFLPIAVALFICLTAAGNALGILHGAPSSDYRRTNLRLILLGEYMMATLFSGYFVAALFPDDHGAKTILTFAVMLATIAGSVALRTNGGTARTDGRDATAVLPDRTADISWKAGMFYFAPADPAIFVPKRIGFGYTLNFAHRWAWAWVAVALAAAVPLAIVLLGLIRV